MKTEQDLLHKIDELHQWLLQEPKGRWEHNQLWSPDGTAYYNKVDELFNLVRILRDTYHPDYLHILDQQIGSIYNHELSLVKTSYDIANRNNAREKDKDSFISSINKANTIIDSHLYGLFKHIEKSKLEGSIQ